MITGLAQDEHGIEVSVDDRTLMLSWTWLRDHARDPGSYLADAEQRVVPPSVVAAAGPGRAEVHDDGFLTVRWPNGPETHFEVDWLRRLGDPADIATTMRDWAVPWTGSQIADRMTVIQHADFDADLGADADGDPRRSATRRLALAELATNGVVLIRGVPADIAATRAVIERFGHLRNTIFGDLWTFESDGAYDDTASTPLEITPHTDGTYSHDAPGLLALHCHRYRATGGENVFVDGFALAAHLAAHFPDDDEVLSTVEIPGCYIGDGAHLVARRPALRHESAGGGRRLVQVSYNHHDRAPFVLPADEMRAVYRALHRFDALAKEQVFQFELPLRPGDMVCFDNWRLLHGRRAFAGERKMAGGYVNREDLDSALRSSGLAPPSDAGATGPSAKMAR